MSHHFPQVGESRPCRVRTPLMKHLNQAMMVAVTVTLMHHIETKVVVVELVSVSDR